MNQLREAVSIPVESRMSPRTPRRSSRSPQTEHKPNAMNPAYMLTMARPIASNLSTVPSEASPRLRPGWTRALNRAADAPGAPAGAHRRRPSWSWPSCRSPLLRRGWPSGGTRSLCDDLLNARPAVAGKPHNFDNIDEEGLRALVMTKAEAVRLLRLGLNREAGA